MNINIEVSQADYDLLNAHLRDELTPEDWLSQALTGKLNSARKAASPLSVAQSENTALSDENTALKAQIHRLNSVK